MCLKTLQQEGRVDLYGRLWGWFLLTKVKLQRFYCGLKESQGPRADRDGLRKRVGTRWPASARVPWCDDAVCSQNVAGTSQLPTSGDDISLDTMKRANENAAATPPSPVADPQVRPECGEIDEQRPGAERTGGASHENQSCQLLNCVTLGHLPPRGRPPYFYFTEGSKKFNNLSPITQLASGTARIYTQVCLIPNTTVLLPRHTEPDP